MKAVENRVITQLEEKLRYLAKVVYTYRRFSKHFGNVEVIANTSEITVKWFEPHDHLDMIHDFESITFPIKDLDTRIETYKLKLNNSFKFRDSKNLKFTR